MKWREIIAEDQIAGDDKIIDAATRWLVRSLEADGEFVWRLETELMAYIEDDLPDDDHPNYAEEREKLMYQALPEWASDACQDTLDRLRRAVVKNGVVKVWRMITAPRDWQPGEQGRPLGKYWSWDEKAAEAHWGKTGQGHVRWLLHGEIAEHDVEWGSTVAQNTDPSYEEEKEITLRAGGKVKLLWYRNEDDPHAQPIMVDRVMEMVDAKSRNAS